jgi:NADPH:quinone reductase-like Zn-dependent oxidoreductase
VTHTHQLRATCERREQAGKCGEGGMRAYSSDLRERIVRAFFFVVKPHREQLIHIGNLIDADQLRPITERVFPLSEASQAFEQALQGHTRGKIILRVEDEEWRE